MVKKRVVVTGLGVVSSIGIGKDAFWKNLLSGTSGISQVRSIDTSGHITHRGGEIKNFKPTEFIDKKRLRFMSRGSQLAFAGSTLAINDSKLKKSYRNKNRVGFCLGTTLGELTALEKMDREWIRSGPQAINRLSAVQFPTTNMASFIAKEYEMKGPVRIFTTACASGNYAISSGYDLIQAAEADIIIAGGADAFAWIPFTGFNQFRAVAPEKVQPFDKRRRGMMVGEGAGLLVLETLDGALKRGAKIYAEILGCGFSCDAYHVTNTQADGIYRCMKDAVRQTKISKRNIDYICAHGTGTRQNDRAETAAIKKLFGKASHRILVSSIKSMLGHAMGAASAMEAICCCLTVQNDIVAPTINYETMDEECDIDCVPNTARKKKINIALNNGFAFGGNNACLVVKKYDNP